MPLLHQGLQERWFCPAQQKPRVEGQAQVCLSCTHSARCNPGRGLVWLSPAAKSGTSDFATDIPALPDKAPQFGQAQERLRLHAQRLLDTSAEGLSSHEMLPGVAPQVPNKVDSALPNEGLQFCTTAVGAQVSGEADHAEHSSSLAPPACFLEKGPDICTRCMCVATPSIARERLANPHAYAACTASD